MKRRSFLKLLSTGAVASTFPSIVRAETLGLNGKISPSNRVNLALIGLGSQGSLHLKNNLGNDRMQFVALCDVDRERLDLGKKVLEEGYADRRESGVFRGVFETQDFREVIARSDVDALLIVLPDHWHALPTILGAQAGKDIFVEKPFSMTIPEGRAMVSAVERSGAICQVGSQQRSSRAFRRLVELVHCGALGKIVRTQVGLPGRYDVPKLVAPLAPQEIPSTFDYDMWLGPAPWAPYYKERCRSFFRYNYDYSGGSLTDWVGHHFDLAQWALGLNRTGPLAIKNAKANFWDSPIYNTPKTYSFEAHYEGGTVIEVANQDEQGNYAIGSIFDDSDGGIFMEGTDGWVKVGRARQAFSSPRLQTMMLPSDGERLDDPAETKRSSHLDNFLDCVRTRRPNIISAEEGHRTASVAHLANLAFRTGRSELRWDPVQERVLDAPDAERLLARAYRAPWQLPV